MHFTPSQNSYTRSHTPTGTQDHTRREIWGMWVRFGSGGVRFMGGLLVSVWLGLLAPYINRIYQTMQAIFAENFSHHRVRSQVVLVQLELFTSPSEKSRMVKLVRATGELPQVSNLLRGQPQQVKDLVIKGINLTLEVATRKKKTIIIDDIVCMRNKEELGHHTSASTQLALPDQPGVSTSNANPNQTNPRTAQLVPDSTSNANPNQTDPQAHQLMALRDQPDESTSNANPNQTDHQNNQLMAPPDQQDDPQTGQPAGSTSSGNPNQTNPQTAQLVPDSTSNANPNQSDPQAHLLVALRDQPDDSTSNANPNQTDHQNNQLMAPPDQQDDPQTGQAASSTSNENPYQTHPRTAQLVPDSTSNPNPNQSDHQNNQPMAPPDQQDDPQTGQAASSTSNETPYQTNPRTAQLVPDSTSNANPNQSDHQNNQPMVPPDQQDDPQTGQPASSTSNENPIRTDWDQSGAQIDDLPLVHAPMFAYDPPESSNRHGGNTQMNDFGQLLLNAYSCPLKNYPYSKYGVEKDLVTAEASWIVAREVDIQNLRKLRNSDKYWDTMGSMEGFLSFFLLLPTLQQPVDREDHRRIYTMSMEELGAGSTSFDNFWHSLLRDFPLDPSVKLEFSIDMSKGWLIFTSGVVVEELDDCRRKIRTLQKDIMELDNQVTLKNRVEDVDRTEDVNTSHIRGSTPYHYCSTLDVVLLLEKAIESLVNEQVRQSELLRLLRTEKFWEIVGGVVVFSIIGFYSLGWQYAMHRNDVEGFYNSRMRLHAPLVTDIPRFAVALERAKAFDFLPFTIQCNDGGTFIWMSCADWLSLDQQTNAARTELFKIEKTLSLLRRDHDMRTILD